MSRRILDTILKEGYSAQNVAYGMGGGLLQKVNRDTMSFATKLCHIVYSDGRAVDVMKKPKADLTKVSLPGILQVRKVNGIPTIFPREENDIVDSSQNLLKVNNLVLPQPHLPYSSSSNETHLFVF
jgi:nicotinic acid phosphoribosyltransferase